MCSDIHSLHKIKTIIIDFSKKKLRKNMIIKLIVFQPIEFVIIMYTINLLKYTYFQWVGLRVTYPTVLKY